MSKIFPCVLMVGLAFVPMTGNAVLFYSTGNITNNTTAPSGSLQDSGWQFQGTFLQYLGPFTRRLYGEMTERMKVI